MHVYVYILQRPSLERCVERQRVFRVGTCFFFHTQVFTGPLKLSDPFPIGRAFTTLTPLIDPLTMGQKLGERRNQITYVSFREN